MSENEELIPTRQSLLSRLKDWDDMESWQDFFDTYWKLIYRSARKAGLSDTEAQDVVQETLLTVCKNIRDLQYDPNRGSFKGWLLKTTMWRIKDYFRKRSRAVFEPLEETIESQRECAAEMSDDEIARSWDKEWEQNLTEAALERTKKYVDPKHFQIFDLAVFKEWPAQKISETLGVSTSYVYVITHRVSSRIKKEAKKLKDNPLLNRDR